MFAGNVRLSSQNAAWNANYVFPVGKIAQDITAIFANTMGRLKLIK
jgi:energy-converting hydrogenase Eha subunit A